MSRLETQAARLTQWCRSSALPLWAEQGLDPEGGFYETLKLDGLPVSDDLRRVRVQARQCYVYAHAGAIGWFENATEIADHGWSYLTQQGFQGAKKIGITGFPGCAHLLNPDGSLNDAWRDTYAQAFLILAASWRYKAFKCAEALTVLEDTIKLLTEYMKTDQGWLEGKPTRLPRRQNPHMHLFEAFLSAFEATHDQIYLDMADNIYELFETVFFDPPTHTIKEFFTQDWQADPTIGDLTEPGHMMEWCWLLHTYHKVNRDDQVIDYAEKLYNSALSKGLSTETGLLVNETRLTGEQTDSTSRCWPQTEFIKAGFARSRFGFTEKDDLTASVIDKLFAHYLDVQITGGWHDRICYKGKTLSQTMPASTFYHLFCAASEADLYLQSLPTDPNKI